MHRVLPGLIVVSGTLGLAIAIHLTFIIWLLTFPSAYCLGVELHRAYKADEIKQTKRERLESSIRTKEIEIYGGVVSHSLIRDEDVTMVVMGVNAFCSEVQKKIAPPRHVPSSSCGCAKCEWIWVRKMDKYIEDQWHYNHKRARFVDNMKTRLG